MSGVLEKGTTYTKLVLHRRYHQPIPSYEDVCLGRYTLRLFQK